MGGVEKLSEVRSLTYTGKRHSLYVNIPAEFAKALGWRFGTHVKLILDKENKRIIIEEVK